MSKIKKINIGITMGDPAGIGPEVLIKAVDKLSIKKFPINFVLIGDKCVLENYLIKFKIKNFFAKENIELIDLKNVSKRFRPGISKPEYGKASLEYIDTAIQLLKEKRILALVTAPVNKGMINKAGIKFPGHTEYLGYSFKVKDTLMMLTNRYMCVVPLTRHISLKDVPRFINKSFIYKGIKLVLDYLKKYFSIPLPSIAILSLNPHGGEAGVIGKEEEEIIIPVIEKFKKKSSLRIFGPYPADGFFAHYKKNQYDCIIGMYHEQVMIPVKIFDPEYTVNITLGLPFIRTSPGHGTALDIAGKGIASFNSMFEAIKMAYQLTRNAFSF